MSVPVEGTSAPASKFGQAAPFGPLRRLFENLRDLDLACREYFLDADIDLATITIAAVVGILPPVAYLDFTYYGLTAGFFSAVFLEAVIAGISLLTIRLIRRQRRVLVYERAVLAWSVVTIAAFMGLTLQQPTRLIENIQFNVLILTALYVALPNRYVLTLAPAGALTLGGIAALVANPGSVAFQNSAVFILMLLAINLAGATVIARSHRFKRREYQAQQNEREARQRYETLAQTDALTGLSNRRSFFEQGQRALSRFQRQGAGLAVVIFDLDYFKRINDTFGHQVGDEALQQFAAVLEAHKRQTDVAGRLGGEEFGLLLEGADQAAALASAARIQAVVRQLRLTSPRGDYQLAFSAGLSCVQPGDQSLEALITRADRALYRAKDLGRDRIEAG